MIFVALDERIHDGIELIAQEDRNDGRRRFISTKTVIIACGGNRHAQELLVFVDRFDHAGLSMGLSPGSNRFFLPADSDQLLCLPEPLMPSKGFSC